NVAAMQDMQQRQQQAAKKTAETLRAEYGREYVANVELANREAQTIWGDESRDVMNIRLADGSFLGDSEWFVRGMVNLARQNGDHGMIERGDGRATIPRDTRLDELCGLQRTNPKQYKSKAVQDEIYQLESARQSQGKRAQR